MADAAVLKSFLVELGFRIDENSGSKFTNSIVRATAEVTAFATAVEGAAALVVKGVAGMADQLEDLYFASKRTGASAENIRTFGFAAERLGSSVAGARGSLEAFRNFLGSAPAANGLLASFGINPNQDPTKLLEDFGDHLRTLPEYMQRIRAEQFGIDWHTALALMDKDFRLIQDDSAKTFTLFGVNTKEAGERAHVFNTQLSLLLNVFNAIRTKVTDVLQQRLGADLARFTELLKQNRKEIVDFIEKVATNILWAGEALLKGIVRAVDFFKTIYDWYNQLDQPTRDFIVRLGEIAVGFALINRILAFNPFVALTAGILLLIEDYEKWKEGGKHLINWEVWEPEIEKAKEQFKVLWGYLQEGVTAIGGWKTVAEGFAIYFAGSWLGSILRTVSTAASGFKILLGPLGAIMAGIAAIEYLGKHQDDITKWGYRNIPGLSFLDNLASKSGVPNLGLSYEQQKKQGLIDSAGNAKSATESSDLPNLWRKLTDSFWNTSSGNWMREAFDKLIANTSAMTESIGKAIDAAMQRDAGMSNAEFQSLLPNAYGGTGGLGPTAPVTTSAETKARAQALMNRLQRDLGITREAAAADVGNAVAESGVRSIPTSLVPQTDRSAFGIWQFTGPRRIARDAFARAHPNLSPEEVDIQYHEWELQNNYPALLNRMRQATRTFAAQADDFTRNYEVPPARDIAGHIAYGQSIYNDKSILAPSDRQQRAEPVPVSQGSSIRIESHLNVNGVHDPRTVSDLIIQAQDRMNLEAIRNAQSAVR